MVESSNRLNSDYHSTLSKRCQDGVTALSSPNGCETTQNTHSISNRYKQYNAYYRIRDGMIIWRAAGWSLWCGSLTQSNWALENRDLSSDINDLERHLDYLYGSDNVRYAYVIHHSSKDTRGALNVHVILAVNGDFDPIEADDYWRKKHGSFFSKLGLVFDLNGYARYLASYLTGKGDFQSARFSYDWLFPKYSDFTRWHNKRFGYYPETELLGKLTQLTRAERFQDSAYRDWWAETQQENYKRSLANRVIGTTDYERKMILNYNKKHSRKIKTW